jgi:hypothetical protein
MYPWWYWLVAFVVFMIVVILIRLRWLCFQSCSLSDSGSSLAWEFSSTRCGSSRLSSRLLSPLIGSGTVLASESPLGNIESGVYVVFEREGIAEPKTALEWQAVSIARRLDAGIADQHLAAVHQQLRLILESLPLQPHPKAASGIDKLIDDQGTWPVL